MSSRKSVERLPAIIHIFYFLLAVSFTYLYYQSIIKIYYYYPPSSIDDILSLTALKVFQYRILVPYIIKALTLFGMLPQVPVFTIFSCIVLYLTLIFYRLVLKEYCSSELLCTFIAPIILYPMLWNFILNNSTFHYYDFTSIMFFVIGCYLILKSKFKLLLLVFILAVLNKESAVILIFAFLFFNHKNIFTNNVIFKTLTLGFVFVLIKTILYFIFINNDGHFMYNKFSINFQILSDAVQKKDVIIFKDIFASFGGLYLFAFIMIFSGKLKLLTRYISPGKIYLNLTFIPYLILAFPVILIDEVRVYTECIPMFTTFFVLYLFTVKKLHIPVVSRKQEKTERFRKTFGTVEKEPDLIEVD